MRLGRRSSHFCRRTSPVRGVLTAAASSVASSMFCGSGVAGKIIRLPMALPNDDLRSVQPVEPSRPLGAYLRHSFGAVGALRRSEHRQHRCACPPLGTGRISDVTYVATWKGFIYVAFVIDAYARKIVGWRVSTSAHAGFVLDALEQAVHDRRPGKDRGLVHHSDRGRQHLSIKSTERLAEAGIEPPVGSVGDSDDKALAETINACSRPRSSTAAVRGAASRPPNTRRWNGSTGSITVGCQSRSGTSRPLKPRPTSTLLWKLNPCPRN